MVLVLALSTLTEVFAAAPTTQARSAGFTNVNSTSMTIAWVNGNGARRVVLMRQYDTHDLTVPPASTTQTCAALAGPTNFSSAGLASVYFNYSPLRDSKVVYSGGGNTRSVSVTGLDPNTTYQVWVFEYNVTGSTKEFNTNPGTSNNPRNVTTKPSDAPVISGSFIGNDAYRISITPLAGATTYYAFADNTDCGFTHLQSPYDGIDIGDVTEFDFIELTEHSSSYKFAISGLVNHI